MHHYSKIYDIRSTVGFRRAYLQKSELKICNQPVQRLINWQNMLFPMHQKKDFRFEDLKSANRLMH